QEPYVTGSERTFASSCTRAATDFQVYSRLNRFTSRMANFYSRFLRTVEKFPTLVAVEFQRESGELESYTYTDLRRMSDSVGNWLSQGAVPQGTRCAILANNGPRWVATYLGILAAGSVAVPFDTAFNSDQVAKLLLDSGADFLFVDSKHLPIAREALKKAPVKLALLQASEEDLPTFEQMCA